jgi:hypothetical protein
MGASESSSKKAKAKVKEPTYAKAYNKLVQYDGSKPVGAKRGKVFQAFAGTLQALESDIEIYHSYISEEAKRSSAKPTNTQRSQARTPDLAESFSKIAKSLVNKMHISASVFKVTLASATEPSPEPAQLKSLDKAKLPLVAKAGLRFGIECLISLCNQVGGASSAFYSNIFRICDDVLGSVPPFSIDTQESSILESFETLKTFLRKISEDQVHSEAIKLKSMNSQLMLSIVTGDTSGLLSFAQTLLLKPPIHNLACAIKSCLTKLTSLKALGPQVIFTWSPNKLGPQILLSDEDRTVTRTTSSGWGCQLSESSISSGVHYVEFFIKANSSTCLLIGVASPSYTSFTSKSSEALCWTLQSDGDSYMNGNSSGQVFRYSQGDRLGLLVDMQDRSLAFYLNGNRQSREPFGGLPEEVYLIICFGGSSQFVEISSDPTIPPDVACQVGSSRPDPLEEHKEVSPDDSQRFSRDSLGILQLPVFSALENDPSEESLTALSQQEQALYIMAHLDSMNSRQMSSLGLNEFKLSRLSTKAFPCSEATLVTLNTILSYCSEFFSHNTWDESSPRTTTWITLVSLRLLRMSLNKLAPTKASLPKSLKNSLNKKLINLFQVWKAECSNEETIEYVQAINAEAALTLTHSFEVFYETLEDKLSFLMNLNKSIKATIDQFNKMLQTYKKARQATPAKQSGRGKR